MEYRIREFNNEFAIEVEMEITTGYLWWKKTHYEWYRCGKDGRPAVVFHLYDSSLPSYKELEKAEYVMYALMDGITYYYPDERVDRESLE